MRFRYIFTFLILSLLQSCGSEINVSEFGKDKNKLDVRVNQLETQADPTKSSNIYFKVKFSNPIEAKTFSATDIVQEGTSSGVVWDVVHFDGGTDYFVIGTGSMSRGTLKPKIAAGTVSNSRECSKFKRIRSRFKYFKWTVGYK